MANAVTDAGVKAVVSEPWRLTRVLALEPGGKLAYRSVKKAVKWMADWTRVGLANLPILPGPVKKTIAGESLEVALRKDAPPPPPPV